VEAHGRLDVLFNNAGVEGELAPTPDYPVEAWDRVIAINLKGVFLGMKYGIQAMLNSGGGSIINTASTTAFVGFANMPAYCASKGGILQITKAAALEYARQGIRVNAICPGGVVTPLTGRIQERMRVPDVSPEQQEQYVAMVHPIGRMGQPEEVAPLALFLASDDSSFCTGAPFVIDGGQVAQ
jgi:NAD(P)-dependent dehydrogenase (short-subunit alcohol dehydrogenase family)